MTKDELESLIGELRDAEYDADQVSDSIRDIRRTLEKTTKMPKVPENNIPKNMLGTDLKTTLKLEVIGKYFDKYDELELERRLA
jgi:hypothetical protein